jgi:hypothetical protein
VVEIDDTPIHWHVTQGALQIVMIGWLSVKMAAKAVCHFWIGVIYKGWYPAHWGVANGTF